MALAPSRVERFRRPHRKRSRPDAPALHNNGGLERGQHDVDHSVALVTTPQPFGGRRWWFVCPSTGNHVAKLHLPPGGITFASRRAYRLPYASQREPQHERALRQAFKLQARLGNPYGTADDLPYRPRGMRQRTYRRLVARLDAAQRAMDSHLWTLTSRLLNIPAGLRR